MASTPRSETNPDTLQARRTVMSLCAHAAAAELEQALDTLGVCASDATDLRRPEIGLVMARGRIGGDGAPFNVGEVSVARAAVRLASGETGFAYQLGRDTAKARSAAILDALWQVPARQQAVERALAPVRRRLSAEAEKAGRRAAATRVDFFTLVRGED